MRISDWSSDVCSSDLYVASRKNEPVDGRLAWLFWIAQGVGVLVKGPITPLISVLTVLVLFVFERDGQWLKKLKPARDRKSVVEGKSVSVRVDLGGRRLIKKKKIMINHKRSN